MEQRHHGKRTIMRRAAGAVLLVALAAGALMALAVAPAPAAAQTPAATQTLAPVWLDAPVTAQAGQSVLIQGGIAVAGDLDGAVVKVYKREIDETADTLIGDARVVYSARTGHINAFSVRLPAAQRNCLITATWDGTADYAASGAWTFVGIKPRLSFAVKSSTRQLASFNVSVSPWQRQYDAQEVPPANVVFIERRVHGVWTDSFGGLHWTRLWTSGPDRVHTYQLGYPDLKPGSYLVRAHFLGTVSNAARVTTAKRIVIE